MSAKARFPLCIVCGMPGVPVGKVKDKEIVVCNECAMPLYDQLGELIVVISGAAKAKAVKRREKAPAVAPAELREMVVKAVEERGFANLFEYCRRYRVSRTDARKLADELAKEKGWVIEEARGKLYLKRGEQIAVS